jgi:phosphoglycerate kinase
MKLNSIAHAKGLAGQRVLVRVDFNVPLEKGIVKDDYRIKAALPTLQHLLQAGAKVIIIAHLGEPGGQVVPSLSLAPVARHLSRLLKRPVLFIKETIGDQATATIGAMRPGDLVFLENLRFNPGEQTNDRKFAKSLAAYGDLYVNEAFSVCHRQQASISAIKKFLPVYYGLELMTEVANLDRVLKPVAPLVVVMGGAKIATKAPLIAKMYPAADQILLGGGLANNFFQYQGQEVGKSLVDKDSASELKKFFKKGALADKIILPIDVIVCGRGGQIRVKKPDEVAKSEAIMDIGPETIALFSSYVKKAQTIIWNGPLGKFEETPFSHGTLGVATAIAARSTGKAFGLVGGGETVEALNKTKMAQYVDFVSTAGGAMLAYLGGEQMPGLE